MSNRSGQNCHFAWATALSAIVFGAASALAGLSAAAQYVIHVSVDGLNARMMQNEVDAGRAPTFKRLEAEAAWTANARTDFTHTITLPDHVCMLTGRPVLKPAGMPDTVYHGVTLNDGGPHGATLHNQGNPHNLYMASVFDVVHDAGLSTGLYVSKDKFVIFKQSYDETNGATGPHGRNKIDNYFFQDDGAPTYSAGMNQRFLTDMAAHHFNYAFIHYRDTDSAGHSFGWGSGTYQQAVAAVDGYLTDVLHLVETDATLSDHTTLIVSTDHGGLGTTHSDPTLQEDFTIPLFVWGAGVSPGDLYAINSQTRADPHDTRPDYNAASQPIRNGDTGNLALSLLGLGPIPGSLINAHQDLRVALVGDYNHDGHVDAADYTIWQDTKGSTTDLRADGNGDGVVDQLDYDLWKADFNATAAAKR
ncbi:MAG TPA: alkaline phosphatase family protein [Lacipirellulaceae bacterium]